MAPPSADPVIPPARATAPPAKDKKKPKWNVNKAPGPDVEIKIDTDEGTWMSVDVSPDGKEIAFDLLGDLYLMPIDGGEARSLTDGMAWDMQPRYSPDGSHIAYTSDRGGGDNIWVVSRDGTGARAVSREDFHMLNSPVWSPDGSYIAARKHFTSQRSLGAGEIWLYHPKGGKGLQMTEKPNEQKDVGEPAFSPDGRYVYFSQDITPGKVFAYNKSPYGEIYAIKRFDRQDGRIEDFVRGPGGAVRPTPSPDGAKLAFVRRVGLKTCLFLHDVESGAERLLYDGLDRDLQETWAIHGVYPAMAWTPDSRSLLFWAAGHIHRIDVRTSQRRLIKFRVRGKRRAKQALRTPVQVHPERFDSKMLRWVQVAPDGSAVVYQALGHLYIRQLPKGQPRRLTSDNDVFEFYPAFSRDGKQIVYTTWSDDTLGQVRVVSRNGGHTRTVSRKPGHYVEPAFSPDGRTIVVRKVAGGWLRSPTWSHKTGLFAIPTQGGPATLVSHTGRAPHFGADNDRVYFLDTKPKKEKEEAQQLLKSIQLNRADPRVHFSSKMATEFRVSPDGKWVAFRELFHLYLTPFGQTGKTVEVGPKAEGLPVVRLTTDAGAYVHWSGDSQKLHWSLGPELFEQTATDALASFSDLPDHKAVAPEPLAGINIGFSIASDIPTGKLAFVGAKLITMRGDEVIEKGTLVVEGNRIIAVGAHDGVRVPKDAKVIDVSGTTIMPGLIDVHAHSRQGGDGIIPQQNWGNNASLAFGVTTIHDPANDTATVFAASEMARAGLITAPRIFSTGTILYGARAPEQAVVESLDDARSHLRRMKAVGAFSVKSYNQPRRDQRQQIIAAARELGMMVVPEGGSLVHHNMTMVVDGHTGVEHALPVAQGYKDLIQLWSGTEVGYTPTLVVGYGGLFGENYWYRESDVFAHPRLRTFVPPFAFDARARRRILASDGDWNHIRIAKLCKKLADAGVHVQVGAHGQREGLGAHWEIWMLVQGGMTALEAIRAATLHGASYLGLDGDLGSLEVGKLADLVVVDGDPLTDIRQSERVRYTLINGRLFDAATLHQIGNHPQKRTPLFWQRAPEL